MKKSKKKKTLPSKQGMEEDDLFACLQNLKNYESYNRRNIRGPIDTIFSFDKQDGISGYVDVIFYGNGNARVKSVPYEGTKPSDFPVLQKEKLFGFKGTWREVLKKIDAVNDTIDALHVTDEI